MLFAQLCLAALGFVSAYVSTNGIYMEMIRGVATCTLLRSTLGSNIVASSGANYTAGVGGAWNLFNTQYAPACIVFPREASHVQAAMKKIFKYQVRYAVQAGGHSAMKGWNNVQDGILISFANMQNVTYDPEKDTIVLQPGVLWKDAIAALEPYGVAPLGGRVGHVGTGLLLGGGLNYLSPQYGFSADLFRELDVVLVTGELVTATATNGYADLFRALKGGANRFGIVTRYEVEAVHTGTKDDERWFGGTISYPDSSAEALVSATAHYVQTVRDPKAALLVGLAYVDYGPSPTAAHFAVLFYQGSSLPPSIFSHFLSLPFTSRALGPRSYQNVSATLGAGDLRGLGQLFGASALADGPMDLYLNAFRHYKNFSMTTMRGGKVLANVLALTPMMESQIEARRRKGGNVIFGDGERGVGEGLGNFVGIQLQTQLAAGVMEVPEDVQRGREMFFEQVPRSPGLPLYVNECDREQNVFETYAGYKELKRTYEKYDPTRFNAQYTDGPIGL